MDQRTLRLLEFHKIQEKLAEYTTFSGGRELALTLLPSANPIWVEEGQAETAEALKMLDGGMSPPFGGSDRHSSPFAASCAWGSSG